ncbi:MAG: alpha-amlyase [Spirosoma sp.]|nr:alpha-amlyase [Spirosoma sp.]
MNTPSADAPRSRKKKLLTPDPVAPIPSNPLSAVDGQVRVVIENVSPEINGGRFPIKAVPGDVIAVEADIFLDGQDLVAARLLYRHIDDETWSETAMAQLNNDRWGAAFIVDRQGRYAYTLEAWVDYPASWQHEVYVKVADGQRITSELLAGAQFVESMLKRAGGKVAKKNPDVVAISRMATLFRTGATAADRYDEAVSLAESDQFTFYATRYPDRRHSTRYNHELLIEVDRPRAGFSSWYCLFPRSAAPEPEAGGLPAHGTFRDVEALLPRISGMGFDVLCMSPIHPIGTAHRKGKNNSETCLPGEPGTPYSIGSADGGHDTIHPELGTIEDFKHLIAIAANYGMEVALDLAIQCSPDHPWVKEHPEWFKKRPDGTIQYIENPPEKHLDIYPIDFEADEWQNLWNELKRVLLVWAAWGVRIVRVDTAHAKPFGFWEWIITEVKRDYPDMLFLAEAFTKPKVMQQLAKRGFTQSFTYFVWRNSKADLQHYVTELTQTDMRYYFRPNFWPATHDINPYSLQSGHEPQFMIRYFLAATLSSNYGIYGPSFELMDHTPCPDKEEFLNAEKYEIRYWDWRKTNKLTYLISLVNRIRKENAALQTTNNLTFCQVSDDAIMAYLKVSDTNKLLVVVNTDAYQRRAGMVQVPIWQLGIDPSQPYTMHDLLTEAYYTWQGEQNYIELDPYVLQLHLLRIEV